MNCINTTITVNGYRYRVERASQFDRLYNGVYYRVRALAEGWHQLVNGIDIAPGTSSRAIARWCVAEALETEER